MTDDFAASLGIIVETVLYQAEWSWQVRNALEAIANLLVAHAKAKRAHGEQVLEGFQLALRWSDPRTGGLP